MWLRLRPKQSFWSLPSLIRDQHTQVSLGRTEMIGLRNSREGSSLSFRLLGTVTCPLITVVLSVAWNMDVRQISSYFCGRDTVAGEILAFSAHCRQITITETEFGGNRKVALS